MSAGPPAARPAAVHRPAPGDLLLIAVAVCAISTSGPLIAACAAPALAIAFWRNAMGTGLLVPWALWRRRAELGRLRGRDGGLAAGAGVLLAAHFATWVPSLTLTTVASSTALVATQPVWAALLARLRGARVPPLAWAGIAVAVLGAGVVTGAAVATSGRAVVGDGLALVGGMLAAGYVTVGAQVRRSVSATGYSAVCYLTASALLVVVCLAGRQALTGYPALAWWQLVAMTVGPQLLGHTVLNRVLSSVGATVVSLAILFEVPGAALLAALVLGQLPGVAALPGIALLLVGVGLVVAAAEPRDVLPAD